MGYETSPNTIDVSNSNTPGVYDPTDPVRHQHLPGSRPGRPLRQFQVTPTNAYSGNNGRAAIYTGDPSGVTT